MKRGSRSKRGGSRAASRPSFSLDKTSQQWIRYWLDSLIDGERLEISGAEIKRSGCEFSYADLVNGLCGADTYAELSRASQKEKNAKQGASSKRENARFSGDTRVLLEILISPIRLRRAGAQDPLLGRQPRFIEPIWIPAGLDHLGGLQPPNRTLPWIPRSLLEPAAGDQVVTIGDVRDSTIHLTQSRFLEQQDWGQYLRACEDYFKTVTGERFSNFKLEGYQKLKNPLAILDSSSRGATIHPQRVYEQLLRGSRPAGLLPQIAELRSKPRKFVSQNPKNYAKQAVLHLGQFESRFPLSPSQRTAVHLFLQLGKNSVLTVNGPPGTGKTTLLQSIIATLWVAAAAKGAQPPIIAACAGTNQAVTNIIESFAKARSGTGVLDKRWLPEVLSYGTYCPSESRLQDNDFPGIHLERTNGEGLSKSMETYGYIQEAQQTYLAHAQEALGKKLTLTSAIAVLRRMLKQELAKLRHDIHYSHQGTWFEHLQSIVGLRAPKPEANLVKTVMELDGTRRHRAFLLATHYWEGRWLSAALEEVMAMEQRRSQPTFKSRVEHWRRRAMVTPCFVSTASMAARFFGELAEDNGPLLDLLIVDEAAQVAPETGASLFALCRRALVVGDTMQLEPVFSIPPHIDEQNLLTHKLLKNTDPKTLSSFARRGVMASNGNCMLLAQSACPVVENSGRESYIGAFLAEHRRSVPEIIAFCNRLAYRGRLKPRRPSLKRYVVPPFGYAHIPGRSQRSGTSRQNTEEAEAIAAWLHNNRVLIEGFYSGKPLDQLVGVITPFAAQRRVLERMLHPTYPEMTIGTVHSLQGAERRLVIFSSVYDRNDNADTFFFDRGKQMLNVAVSRAQDAFLVFGDMAIFDPNRRAPSGLLARFMFARPENELVDIAQPIPKRLQNEEMVRLSSLEQHRNVLQQAFANADAELLIVSPQVSSVAIEEDRIVEQIQRALARGVSVQIYTDAHLDIDHSTGELRPNAERGRRMLLEAGAKVFLVNGIHNKTLAIDQRELVEGSFNWLSAVRSAKRRHHREETSWHYRGAKAAGEIAKTKEFLQYRLLESL